MTYSVLHVTIMTKYNIDYNIIHRLYVISIISMFFFLQSFLSQFRCAPRHRVGRAGRFGTKGLALTFVATDEDQEAPWSNDFPRIQKAEKNEKKLF